MTSSLLASIVLASTLPSRWEFIWACYGVTLLVFVVLIMIPIIRRAKLNQQLLDYYRRKELLNGSQQSEQAE